MRTEHTRRGQTQNRVIKRQSLLFATGGFTAKVILNLFQDLTTVVKAVRFQTKFGMTPLRNRGGFTLIEILVVVLIIGILGAIALPQYQRAVLKSRFAALMPIAKSMADSNELFYLEHGNYTDDPQAFQVQGRRDYADGTHLDFGTTTDYAYVLAKNEERIPNNTYVVYQKHSVNYPGEIHCEALADDSLAEGVCKSFGATRHIGPTITATHNTWLLEGSRGAGIEPEALEDEEDDNGQTVAGCVAAVAMGYTCDITTNTQGQMVKQICSNGFCRTKTYNEDGSYTSVTCQANSERVCISDLKTATYDANGNKLTQRTCSSIDSNGNCTAYSSRTDYTYDANGKTLTSRTCSSVNSNGTCTAYSSGQNNTYDANGNILTYRFCSSVASNGSCTAYSGGGNYTYDANGNKLSERYCSSVASNGTCTAYSGGSNYTYDTNGNKLSERYCSSVASNGTCTAYSTSSSYDYTYDANGKVTKRVCSSFDSNGNCTAHSYGYNYTYDANGNKLTERSCSKYDSNGTCTAYGGSGGTDYTYDANRKVLTSRSCSASNIDSSGNCTAYSSGYNYTYDANGNTLTQRHCSSFDSNGNCTAYDGTGYDWTYDDNGKQIAYQSCSGDNINASTGECIAYDSTGTDGF